MPRVIHTCTHCNKPYTGLKYLINHINKSHEGIDTTELFNQWARHNDVVKTNNRKINRPAIVNNENMTYHQFLSVKTTELKQTRPDITKQSDRIKVIAQMWRERDNVVNVVVDEVVDEVVDVKSPEPSSVPIPYNLIEKMKENKIIDDVIDNVIDDVVNDVELDDIIESVDDVIETHDNVIEDVEPVEVNDEDDEDDDMDIEYDETLIECCKSFLDGGFIKAYHHLVRHNKIEKVKTKKRHINDIKDDLEEVFNLMCDAWFDYSRSNDYDGNDEFDDDAEWLDVCGYVITKENLCEFQ